MAGKVIGKTLDYGFPGTVSRASDTVIMAFPVVNGPIKFGAPVAFVAEKNAVAPVTAGTAAADIIGIAVREVRQPYEDSEEGWFYKESDTCNVLVRGTAVVELSDATGLVARGPVHVKAADAAFTSVADGNLAVSHAIFSTGRIDGNKVAEVTLLERVI